MNVKKFRNKFYFLAALFAQLAFLCPNAYASEETSISVTVSEPSSWTMTPRNASTATFPISIVTNNPNGYSIRLNTTGPSTDLVSVSDETKKIPTITLENGQTSIELSDIRNAYGFSTDGTNFKPVPEPGGNGVLLTEVSRASSTEPNIHDLTLGVKTDATFVPSGRYENTFLVTVVAKDPIVCEIGYICYERNGGDMDGTMEKQEVSNSEAKTIVTAPSFSRSGYGFAGWNTKIDGSGTNIGPNESIDTAPILENGLVLYANWVKSVGELQTWNGCSELSKGDIIALTDNRDGNTYAVAKLADGGCWMIENLRLDLSKSGMNINATTTNNPTDYFISQVQNNPSTTNSFCTAQTKACIETLSFANLNTNPELESYWSAYGGYYNWYTATAGNGKLANNKPEIMVSGDLCPAHWSLPTGNGDTGDLAQLDIALGGNGKNSSTTSERWRKYPVNLVFSGELNGNIINLIGGTGNYQTASPTADMSQAMNIWMKPGSINFNTNGGKKTRGQTIRCVYNKHYKIHFDKNINQDVEGEMPDFGASVDVSMSLPKNTFVAGNKDGFGHRFLGWNTKADGSGDSYADSGTIRNLAAAGDMITLYAQWEYYQLVDVTIDFSTEGITNVSFVSSGYPEFNVTENSTISLAKDKVYQVTIGISDGYILDDATTTSGGVINLDKNTYSATYTISSAATLSISAKVRTETLYFHTMSATDCSTSPTTVYDIRDGEAYRVQRLADGRCWMLDNLRITGDSLDQPLTTTNTNMSPSVAFTLPSSGIITDTYGTPMLNADNKDMVPTKHFGEGGSGKVGVYYDFCAMTAGTICEKSSPQNAEFDICPAGWRLPTGGNNSEYSNLFGQYSVAADFRSAFAVTYGGWYEAATGTVKSYNSVMFSWSSTHSNNTNKSYYFKDNNGGTPSATSGGLETNGFTARCVMK